MYKYLFMGDPRNQGGIETFGRNLSKIFKNDMCFFSYETKGEVLYPLDNVFELEKKKYHPKLIRKTLQIHFKKKFVKDLVEKEKIEVCVLNTPQDMELLEGLKVKKILVQHQTADVYWRRDTYFNKDEKLLKTIRKKADKVVTLSPYDEEEFLRKFNLDKEKTSFIRHISEIPLLKENKKKGKKLIIIARIEKVKRIDLAIKAMVKLSDYTLDIYGRGPQRENLEKLIEDLNLTNVSFKGITNNVLEKLDENSMFIMTSDYEGYGITNIEAMRRGLPIVLRDTFTAARDIVDGNGILLSKEWNEDSFIEAIEKIYEDYTLYSKRSLELGKRHELETLKEKWLDIVSK